MRTIAPRVRRRRLSLPASLLVWTALAALAWLDASRPMPVQHAAVFAVIVTAISWIVNAVKVAGVAIEVSLEAFVSFLANALSWLGGRVVDLMKNTGAMFSKVWEGAKIVYSDVLKPVAQWFKDVYDKVKDWMVKVFGPMLKWADRVRCELTSIYKRYVKPILNILDTTKAVLDILAKLHVPFAQAAENVVNDIEQVITENYLRLLGYVNDVINTLNGFFTLDGLLQRFTFLRTLERDAFFVWRVMQNSRARKVTADEQEATYRATHTLSPAELNDSLAAYWSGDDNDVGQVIDALSARYVADWQSGGDGATA